MIEAPSPGSTPGGGSKVRRIPVNCDEVQKDAFTYLDGEFDGREKAEFDCHLAACTGCRGKVEQVAGFRSALRRNLCTTRVEGPTRIRVMARLDACEVQGGFNARIPMAMAAALLLAVGGWRVWVLVDESSMASESPSMATALPTSAVALADGGVVRGSEAEAAHGAEADAPLAATDRGAPARLAGVGERGAALADSVAAAHDRAIRQVVAEDESADAPEVLGGAVDASFLTGKSPFGAVRTGSNLRSLVRFHAVPLPLEVRGHAAVVRQWLGDRLPGIKRLPVAEGAGVELLGARLSQLAGRPVVLYAYTAYGKALTVVQHLRAEGQAPFLDPEIETQRPGEPDTEPGGALVDHLAGYQVLHALRDGELLTVVSELDSQALRSLVAPPTYL